MSAMFYLVGGMRLIVHYTLQNRGFKVGMALEFEEHFICFNSIDLVFQVRPFGCPV